MTRARLQDPPRRSPQRLLLGLTLAALGLSFGVGPGARSEEWELDEGVLDDLRETIDEDEALAHVRFLAAPELEGRDSPSVGLERAAAYLAAELESYGFAGAGDDGAFLRSFTRALPVPDPDRCELAPVDPGEDDAAPRLGEDFVPLPGCAGEGSGPLVFVGFGIDRKGYDDFARKDLDGAVALLIESEPRHRRVFEGPEVVTEAADVYAKVEALIGEDVDGVLVVRRPPEEATEDAEGDPLAPSALGYRFTWADWNPATTEAGPRQRRSFRTPVLEVTPALASRLLGQDVLALAEKGDASGKPVKAREDGPAVHLRAGFRNERVAIDNVVGILRGSDPELAAEALVLGAHYDHIGVDPRGRVGFGADDNASGTSAMLEVAQALASSPPRRSVIVAFFGAEEDGLLGSRAFVDDPPVPRESLVAMLNMDMVGRGDEDEVVVLGCDQNPDLEELLEDGDDAGRTGIKDIVTNRAQHLWQRSDHYSFHRAGVPVLFFFEAVSEDLNPDYHTFRDTVEALNVEKVANTARLCLNVAWLVANVDERPGAPRR